MTHGQGSTASRVRTVGVRGSSITDLLAIALARREADADASEETARRAIQRFGGIRQLVDVSIDDLNEMAGLEGYEALRCLALMELGRRSAIAATGPKEEIASPDDAIAHFEHLRFEKREHFAALLLDAKGRVMRLAPIHIGTLTQSIVGAREVFREAIREGASSMVVGHNHPSGDPTPSPEDLEVTQLLVDVGAMLDTPVLDHVIVGDPKTVSFVKRGIMPTPNARFTSGASEARHTAYRAKHVG